MNLKKSDKMIAIIGVVILIVAAISIVYYYVSTEDEVGEPTTGEKVYKVTWEEKNGEMKILDKFFFQEIQFYLFVLLIEVLHVNLLVLLLLNILRFHYLGFLMVSHLYSN